MAYHCVKKQRCEARHFMPYEARHKPRKKCISLMDLRCIILCIFNFIILKKIKSKLKYSINLQINFIK